jgi:hypothetical protein
MPRQPKYRTRLADYSSSEPTAREEANPNQYLPGRDPASLPIRLGCLVESQQQQQQQQGPFLLVFSLSLSLPLLLLLYPQRTLTLHYQTFVFLSHAILQSYIHSSGLHRSEFQSCHSLLNPQLRISKQPQRSCACKRHQVNQRDPKPKNSRQYLLPHVHL